MRPRLLHRQWKKATTPSEQALLESLTIRLLDALVEARIHDQVFRHVHEARVELDHSLHLPLHAGVLDRTHEFEGLLDPLLVPSLYQDIGSDLRDLLRLLRVTALEEQLRKLEQSPSLSAAIPGVVEVRRCLFHDLHRLHKAASSEVHVPLCVHNHGLSPVISDGLKTCSCFPQQLGGFLRFVALELDCGQGVQALGFLRFIAQRRLDCHGPFNRLCRAASVACSKVSVCQRVTSTSL
mmetsp:Transcript_93306/g.237452  ORF Transcript_93306/g.237452 Transcript_93306/m.237452 type:complete len:238 (-) Transcript_93306:572-1285(-)